MTDSAQWIAAKSIGDEAELEICSILSSWGGVAGMRAIGRAPSADLAVMFSIEVKADGAAAKTGNVAIEIESAGRPSGLLTTRAALWAIRAGGEWHLVPVPMLQRLAGNVPIVAANGGGTKVALVRLEKLKSVSLVIRPGDGI
jgi:hypothetical protein